MGANDWQWKVLVRTCVGDFLGFGLADMPFVRHSNKVKYVRLLSNWLQNGTNAGTLD